MPYMARLRGAILLLILGIIFIIFAAISLFGGIAMFGMSSMFSLLGFSASESVLSMFTIMGVISLASGIVYLVFGIFGIRFRNKPDKVNALIIFGIILLIVNIFSILYNKVIEVQLVQFLEDMFGAQGLSPESLAAMGVDMTDLTGGSPYAVVGNVISFVLCGLYIVGALLNKLPPKTPAHLQEFYAQQGQAASYMQQQGQGVPYAQQQGQGASPYIQDPQSQQGGSDSPYEPGYKPPGER